MSVTEPAHQPSQASISVIVPAYNSARFIREALDSILAQRLQPEQIVVVDDGSTDNTAEVVGRYKDRRIQYIRQAHTGVAGARNAGLDAARGEYIAFLDADDRWRPIFLEMLHGYLSEDPTAGLIFSNFVRFEHGTGKLLGDQFHSYPAIKRPVLLKDEPFAHGRIPKEKAFSALVAFEDIPAYPQVMMFRRSIVENLRFDASPAKHSVSHSKPFWRAACCSPTWSSPRFAATMAIAPPIRLPARRSSSTGSRQLNRTSLATAIGARIEIAWSRNTSTLRCLRPKQVVSGPAGERIATASAFPVRGGASSRARCGWRLPCLAA